MKFKKGQIVNVLGRIAEERSPMYRVSFGSTGGAWVRPEIVSEIKEADKPLTVEDLNDCYVAANNNVRDHLISLGFQEIESDLNSNLFHLHSKGSFCNVLGARFYIDQPIYTESQILSIPIPEKKVKVTVELSDAAVRFYKTGMNIHDFDIVGQTSSQIKEQLGGE